MAFSCCFCAVKILVDFLELSAFWFHHLLCMFLNRWHFFPENLTEKQFLKEMCIMVSRIWSFLWLHHITPKMAVVTKIRQRSWNNMHNKSLKLNEQLKPVYTSWNQYTIYKQVRLLLKADLFYRRETKILLPC